MAPFVSAPSVPGIPATSVGSVMGRMPSDVPCVMRGGQMGRMPSDVPCVMRGGQMGRSCL